MKYMPPDEDVILYDQGFDDDLLERKRVSKSLSDLMERVEDPLVVAIDGRWGSGKSYFLKRWVGAHKLQNGGKAMTIYFDAFAHDFLEDPLIALVGAVSERVPRSKKRQMDKVKSLTLKLFKPAARIGLSMATFGATEALGDIGDALAEAASDEAKLAVTDTDFWKHEESRRAAMEQFRSALTELLEAESEQAKLVIVIDELDRCRPDYALQVLEVLKHFFSVPNVHFILGTNLSALENSVRARYGAEIDASAYLQKFISFSLSLPENIGTTRNVVAYAKHLGRTMKLPAKLVEALIEHLEVVANANPVSMRDIGKIMSSIALSQGAAHDEKMLFGWREVIITLICSKILRPELYLKFRTSTISDEELRSYYGITDRNSTPEIGGVRNQHYNPRIKFRYLVWSYITGNELDESERTGAESLFSMYFPEDFPSTIPKRVHDDWLDLLNAAH